MPEDPFDLLGLTPRFEIDPADLERHYLAKASALNTPGAGDNPQAAGAWALLNDARATLADPERRANVLLARLGGPRPELEKSLPPGFLAEMMEVRESIESATASKQPKELANWQSWAKQRRRQFISELARSFAALPPTPGAPPLREIRIKLNAWRYIERLVEQVEA